MYTISSGLLVALVFLLEKFYKICNVWVVFLVLHWSLHQIYCDSSYLPWNPFCWNLVSEEVLLIIHLQCLLKYMKCSFNYVPSIPCCVLSEGHMKQISWWQITKQHIAIKYCAMYSFVASIHCNFSQSDFTLYPGGWFCPISWFVNNA